MSEDDQELSFRNFFIESISPHLPTSSSTEQQRYELVYAEVGTSKEKMDKVNLELSVVGVVESFGRFVKYFVHVSEVEATPATAINAFDVLMASQQALQSCGKDLPDPVPEKNRKDKLCTTAFEIKSLDAEA